MLTDIRFISNPDGYRLRYYSPAGFPQIDDPIQPAGIEMRLGRRDIKEMVDFLYRVEHSKNLLLIDKVKIQPAGSGKSRSLEPTLPVTTYTLAGL